MRQVLVLSVLASLSLVGAFVLLAAALVDPVLSWLAPEAARWVVLGGAAGLATLPPFLLTAWLWRRSRRAGRGLRLVRTALGMQIAHALLIGAALFALTDMPLLVQARGSWLVEAFSTELGDVLPPEVTAVVPLGGGVGTGGARSLLVDALAENTLDGVAPFLDQESAAGIAVPWASFLHAAYEMSDWGDHGPTAEAFAPLLDGYELEDPASMWKDTPELHARFVPHGRDFLEVTGQAAAAATKRRGGPTEAQTAFPWARFVPATVLSAGPASGPGMLDYTLRTDGVEVSFQDEVLFFVHEEDGAPRLGLDSFEELAAHPLGLSVLPIDEPASDRERRAAQLFEVLQRGQR